MRCALQFEVKEAPRLTTRAKPSATVAAAAAEKPAPRKRLSYRVERPSKAPAKAALPKATQASATKAAVAAKRAAVAAKRAAVAEGTVATQTRRAAPAPVSRKANDDSATKAAVAAKRAAVAAKRAAVAEGTVATQTRRAAPAPVSRKANDDNAVGSFVELSIGVVGAFFFVDSRASSARNE